MLTITLLTNMAILMLGLAGVIWGWPAPPCTGHHAQSCAWWRAALRMVAHSLMHGGLCMVAASGFGLCMVAFRAVHGDARLCAWWRTGLCMVARGAVHGDVSAAFEVLKTISTGMVITMTTSTNVRITVRRPEPKP